MDVYEIIKTIGSGSFGQVYLARHKREGKNYVIKRVKTRDMSQKDLENTENEVRLLQKIRHTNIVAYKDSYVDNEQFLNIVMVYCDGGDIYTKIKASKGKNFPESQILDWLVQMALALLYLHERKILHRDMKTQNIFLKNGKIRLGDFGIAKVLDSTKDFANTCIGTPYYMSPELFKNKPYSYKSDVWALGCVLYEMCNLRHAFDAQSINGLAVKILRGSYPPINTCYSKSLRDLIGKMLSIKPQQRPTILDILNKMIVRKQATKYFNECLNSPSMDLGEHDVDDLFVDGLREQAQNLQIPGFVDDSTVAGRLASGNPSTPLQGKVNPKKLQAVKEKTKKELQTEEQKKKEIMRLRRELKEKERMEKRLKELEDEALAKEEAFKRKYAEAEQRRKEQLEEKQNKAIKASKPYQKPSHQRGSSNRSSSVPAATKQKHGIQMNLLDNLAAIDEEENIQQSPQKPDRGRAGRPHASSFEQYPENEDNSKEARMIREPKKKLPHTNSSGGLLTDGPLNTYQDFKNVFNAKQVGPKSTRRHQQPSSIVHNSDKQEGPERLDRAVRSSSQNIQKAKNNSSINMTNINVQQKQQEQIQENSAVSSSLSARDKVLQEKEARRIQQQQEEADALEKIRLQNMRHMKDAQVATANQYRTSQDQKVALFKSPKKAVKKIQEDYTMFDEQQDQDDELEDIMEAIQEESGDELDEGEEDEALQSAEMKTQMRMQKESMRELRTQMMTIKSQLQQKTSKIDKIRGTLKENKVQVVVDPTSPAVDIESSDDHAIDQAVKEFQLQNGDQEDDEEDIGLSDGSSEERDDLEEDSYGEDQDGDINDRQDMLDPQILKLTDKIKLFRHRCVASLGYNLFESAFSFLKQAVAEKKSTQERRDGLIKILGHESVGFWAILDQILFYEDLVDEISTASSTN